MPSTSNTKSPVVFSKREATQLQVLYKETTLSFWSSDSGWFPFGSFNFYGTSSCIEYSDIPLNSFLNRKKKSEEKLIRSYCLRD